MNKARKKSSVIDDLKRFRELEYLTINKGESGKPKGRTGDN